MAKFRRDFNFKEKNRYFYFEEQKMSQSALMDIVNDFKSLGLKDGKCATLFSVMGGRISEGMDFPAEQLEIALIVGIPYPKPTARQRGLQRYYELKFRKGWEYTVEAPTARKLLQSIGRLIRDEQAERVGPLKTLPIKNPCWDIEGEINKMAERNSCFIHPGANAFSSSGWNADTQHLREDGNAYSVYAIQFYKIDEDLLNKIK